MIQIRVTDTEKRRILRSAKRCRMSVSEYLRSLADGHSPAEYPAELHLLCSDIEFLMEEYYGRHDEKFTAYLKAFLDDVRTVLFPVGGEKSDGGH